MFPTNIMVRSPKTALEMTLDLSLTVSLTCTSVILYFLWGGEEWVRVNLDCLQTKYGIGT